jgi:hypothetical protein
VLNILVSFFLKIYFLRTSIRIHRLIQHIQGRVETDLRVWRYLLPPGEEKDGHEIQGTLPVWQPVVKTDHLICQTGKKLSW